MYNPITHQKTVQYWNKKVHVQSNNAQKNCKGELLLIQHPYSEFVYSTTATWVDAWGAKETTALRTVLLLLYSIAKPNTNAL